MPGYSKGHIGTFTGRLVDPLNMNYEDVRIEDIAHALSHMPRFGGHAKDFYSVAQHSLGVAFALYEDTKNDLRTVLAGLLHDASEAYLMDIPTPIKARIGELYSNAEARLQGLIYRTYVPGYMDVDYAAIKQVDSDILVVEAKDLCTPNRWIEALKRPEGFARITPVPAKTVEFTFLRVFNTLKNHPDLWTQEPRSTREVLN
jgi:hypothetical protein